MEPQHNPPPGWYPDPAGGPHYRHWDGLQWTVATWPATPPKRSRRRRWVIVAVVAGSATAVGLVVAVVVFVSNALGPGMGELTAAADTLTFPPGLTLVDETSTGNRMCMEECVRLSRTYTSPFPGEATIKVAVTALEKAGYRCVVPSFSSVDRDWCGTLEVNVLSYWKRGNDSVAFSLVVHPIPSTWASMELSDMTVDPASQSYVDVFASVGDVT